MDMNHIKACLTLIKNSNSIDEIRGIVKGLEVYITPISISTYTVTSKGMAHDTKYKIAAIKELRTVFNPLGLKEAKDAVEVSGYVISRDATENQVAQLRKVTDTCGLNLDIYPNTVFAQKLYGE